MAPINDQFDASGIQPQQGMSAHPPGMFDFQITNTRIVSTKDNSGGMFVVEFTSPAGRIENRYNMWNNSPQAVEIARKELSALCHAVGMFKLDFNNDGAALRGCRGKMEVVPQLNREGQPNGYMEVKRVFDSNGIDPVDKARGGGASQGQPNNFGGQQQQQQPQQSTPMTQQPNGSWGNQQAQQPQQQQQPQQGQGGWNNQQQPQQTQQPQNNQPQNNGGGWQPGGAAGGNGNPPWVHATK